MYTLSTHWKNSSDFLFLGLGSVTSSSPTTWAGLPERTTTLSASSMISSTLWLTSMTDWTELWGFIRRV